MLKLQLPALAFGLLTLFLVAPKAMADGNHKDHQPIENFYVPIYQGSQYYAPISQPQSIERRTPQQSKPPFTNETSTVEVIVDNTVEVIVP
jgi:hypothetical protein